jgi:ABC-2 type transport system ATP-binding protein
MVADAALETLPVKLRQTHESIQHTVEQIETCFTSAHEVMDQLERACDLVLNFTKQFGVDPQHRIDAISHKSSALQLHTQWRSGALSRGDFQAEEAQLRQRVLQLTNSIAQTAKSHLARVDALSPEAKTDPTRVPRAAELPPSDLRSSLEHFLTKESGDGMVFRCRDLGKRYGVTGPFVIKKLDMELRNGQITGVVGLNGSGKTTLLRMVAGGLEPTGGHWEYPALRCSSTSWVTIRRSIAFVAQRPDRWNGTVEDALILQAACFGDTGREGARMVDFYIARLGLTAYRHHTWGQLSGGYRTRFELAKAMLSRPRMLVLDEPLAALDVSTQMRFLTDLEDFATTFAAPMPVLISSQHIYEVEAIAKQIIVIRDGLAIYNGPTASLGEDRAVNGFELSCDLDLSALTAALADRAMRSIRKVGPREWFVTTDPSVSADQVLDAMKAAKAGVRYFRDASRSSRMFFDS